ncbi:hypothetical protein SLA2020_377710 [Shorea laevis]
MGTNSEESLLLHGDLELRIIAARALGTSSEVDISSGVTVSVAETVVTRTPTSSNSSDSQQGEHFNILLAHPVVDLELKIKVGSKVRGGKRIKGTVKVPAWRIITGEIIREWYPMVHVKGDRCKNLDLDIVMKFTPCDQNPLYDQGIAGDPEQAGVRNTYFPLREGNKVKLYQDAHVPEEMSRETELVRGRFFEHPKCWEDICHAILEAQHMTYIVGWSVSCDIKLVREPTRPLPRGGDLTLGELLKSKSEEGVQVVVLIWDDKTSYDIFGIQMRGVMQTHDEETRKFFKDSSVICKLVHRQANKSHNIFTRALNGFIFSNHQKYVLVDTQAADHGRRITAFLGGLDLCKGRYDTPEHSLFRGLATIFKDDFHNPTFPSKTKAPREPWHDWHCRIDGPAALDVFRDLEQRWWKSARKKKHDALISMESILHMLSPSLAASADGTTVVPEDYSTLRVFGEDNPENWHVQIFRSTDSGAVKGFPEDLGFAYAQNLVCSKGLVKDVSIQTAYIQSIRSAQHFIYIENQYFIGSSYAWPSNKDAGANNLIPMELALKITSKIRANERFAVYVIIPMWPEGDPNSKTVQEILFWQSQTMKMMYGIIAKELQNMGHQDAHPQDYLNFYCLGKRECIPGENPASDVDAGGKTEGKRDWLLHLSTRVSPGVPTSGGDPSTSTRARKNKVSKSQEFQRFMIYVHAKGMIVDDEYVILGSANINQRSMDGSRDTEIAMGAYQPHCTWGEEHPRGEVFGYRKSLWAEHLGTVDGPFDDPESLECVKEVNKIAEENWEKYTAAKFTVLQGYLLKYPIQVEKDGEVSPLPGYETFPDVGGQVLGKNSLRIPNIVTT